MLGWIKIYDRPRTGPSGPPERSLATENRKNERQIFGFKLRKQTHSNRLAIPKKTGNSTPESP